MKNKPLVSINLRTFNSERTVEKTMKSAKDQTYSNIEVVVADGFSKDNTIKILKKYKARIFYEDKLGDARIRNIRESKGKYVLSLDSDQIMDKNLIRDCVKKCEEDKYDALIISEKSLILKGNYLEKLIAYDKMVIDKSRDINHVYGTASPRFFKKSLLDKIDWPEKIAIFDDAILYSRLTDLNAKIGYVDTSSIYHHEVNSWWILAKKFFRYGQGYFRALKARPTTVSMHSLPRKSYFSKHAFSQPQYFFGLFLLYGLKVSAASFGASYFLFRKVTGKE